MLGDLGFHRILPSIIALLATGFWNAHLDRPGARRGSGRSSTGWGISARMIQVSMIAFCVAGAALSMAFYDYFLSLLIVLSALRQMVMEAVGRTASRRPQADLRKAVARHDDDARKRERRARRHHRDRRHLAKGGLHQGDTRLRARSNRSDQLVSCGNGQARRNDGWRRSTARGDAGGPRNAASGLF